MDGAVCEVFARTLRGLSGAKLTKPGAFRTSDGEAYALRCSYKVLLVEVVQLCSCEVTGTVCCLLLLRS